MKSDWTKLTDKTTKALADIGHELVFNTPSTEGHFVKSVADPDSPGVFWAFARTKDELWVELEIRPRKGKPQTELYEKIKSYKPFLHKEYGKQFTWDEADRASSNKRSDRNYYRIKSYIITYYGSISSIEQECVDSMMKFYMSFVALTEKIKAEEP